MVYRAMAYPGDQEGLVLSDWGWFVLVLGAACLVLSVAMRAYVHHLSPPAPEPQKASPEVPEASDTPAAPEPPAERDLDMLGEDERRLYDMIVDRGGEVLQRDIVASGEFSKAKVTRLLDKLEGRELLKRERHGMTNRVKLVR
jgi:uncharacterized membrane protein